MSRNRERDETIKARCKLAAMESGFRLFSEKGIDPVKMSDIVEDCGVSRQSLYRYFSTKTDLVIAIGAWKWKEYISRYVEKMPGEKRDELTAADRMRMYLDAFIDLYRNYKDILRYNYYFNSFLANEQTFSDQKQLFTEMIDNLRSAFHRLYEKGQEDGTLRTDLPESVIFSSSLHIMLAAATRYAMGLVYVAEDHDPETELILLKEALLRMYIVGEEKNEYSTTKPA